MGATLTVIYSAECAAPKTSSRPAAVMPLLVILFVVSYVILTMLVFEQGQTIEAQRGLIREMLKDSNQLSALRDKMAQIQDKQKSSLPADPKSVEPKTADPANSAAGANSGTNKGADTKSLDKEAKHPGKSTHATKEIPGKPAADLEDVRRAVHIT
jgi:hypothetical protein